MATLKLAVGLGNPGTKYQGTRHNVGFDVIDRLAAGGSRPSFSRKFDGLLAETEIDFRRVLLLKPETFMNLSGRSVAQALRFYKLEPADLLVVCDDLSLPLGKLRLRPGGSDGGQKGLARHHRQPRHRPVQPAPHRHRRTRRGRGHRLRPQPVPQRRTADHRRRPDPRHPGRRRLGHPGHRRGDEPVQRVGGRGMTDRTVIGSPNDLPPRVLVRVGWALPTGRGLGSVGRAHPTKESSLAGFYV